VNKLADRVIGIPAKIMRISEAFLTRRREKCHLPAHDLCILQLYPQRGDGWLALFAAARADSAFEPKALQRH
jgi:hypothetical protein